MGKIVQVRSFKKDKFYSQFDDGTPMYKCIWESERSAVLRRHCDDVEILVCQGSDEWSEVRVYQHDEEVMSGESIDGEDFKIKFTGDGLWIELVNGLGDPYSGTTLVEPQLEELQTIISKTLEILK